MTATNPAESISFEVIVSDAPGLESSSMEATTHMPTMPRLPRQKQSAIKEK